MKKYWQMFLCWWSNPPFSFHHKNIRVVKRLSPNSYKAECKDCGRAFGINEDIRVVLPWNSELEDMYKLMDKWEKEMK